MSKKTEYHIVELYRGVRGEQPQYYLWRTGAMRGLLPGGVKLYDTYEKAVVARDEAASGEMNK